MRSRRLKNVVWLRLLYDPFVPETVETHELQWRKGATVAAYLDGLPPEAEWMVFVNGREIDLVTEGETVLDREDQLGLILVPQGGDGGIKSVLRIVLQAAAIALAFVPGIGWAAALAINIGIGLVNAFLLTPKPPKQNGGDSDRSYGIDGAKNSATEGIPYPVVYGEFRTAGNFSDCYTVNVGDTQYLYIRAILNDGEIAGVSDIEINEQPISSFTDVQTRIALGRLDQDVNDWFTDSIVQVNKSVKIGTAWSEHITTSAVDKIRWDIVFSNGLVNIDSKKGTYKSRSVTFAMEVQQIDPNTLQPITGWTPVQTGPSTFNPDLNGDGILTLNEILGAQLYAKANSLSVQSSANVSARAVSTAPAILYRQVGDSEWDTFGTFDSYDTGYAYDASGDGSVAGATDVTPQVNRTFSGDLPAGNYEFMPINGAEITGAQAWPSAQSLTQTVTDSRTRQIRHSFETGQLAKGFYRCRIRRTSATSTDQYQIDEVYLADVAEIELDQVPQIGTASLSLRIKLTEQLNSIPTITCKVKGSLCQTYDVEGNPLGEVWTANPAWQGLDVLCGKQRGAIAFERAKKRIDWPRLVEFAEHCENEKLAFNGVFAEKSNVGDVLNGVFRIGHASPIPFGTKISVAIDRKRDPVAYFGPAQILKDSFEISYMSMADRANEYEITYYDKLDRNKAKTLRYVDPKAVQFNEVQRLAQVSFPGIDNVEQAKAELWRAIYANRLLMRTITFDSFMNSINLGLGEVALIQHDQMAWATGGLLAAGSTTTTLQLDRPVAMEEGKSYSAIVHFDALKRAERQVGLVAGRKVMVTGASISSLAAKRLVAGDQDIEVVSMVDGNPYHTITLANAPQGLAQGQTVELWDTDALIELPVLSAPGEGLRAVTVTTPFPQAPGALAAWVFGEVKNVRKPFALTGVSGTGIEKRKLTFMEYHEGVYGPPEVEIPIPVAAVTDRDVAHVSGLLFDYERLVAADRKTINARVHWSAAGIRNYAGADVYMSLNGEAFRPAGNAENMNELPVALNEGDVPEFKVVAYNKRGDRATFSTAPSVKGTIAVVYADLSPPQDFRAVPQNFQAEGKAQLKWSQPADMTGVIGFEARYRKKTDGVWTALATNIPGPDATGNRYDVTGLETATYVFQMRSTSVTSVSPWVEAEVSIAAIPGSIMSNFLSSNNRNASAIPAPVTRDEIDVDHVINNDGSADVSFEWEWAGDEASIDGFEVKLEVADS